VPVDQEIIKIDAEIFALQMSKDEDSTLIEALLKRRQARLLEIEHERNAASDLTSGPPQLNDRFWSPFVSRLDWTANSRYRRFVGVAAAFIKIDAEVHRVKAALKASPKDQALKKELNGLIKAREKLLVEAQRKAKASISNDNYKRLKGE
jgi:hypothetical protein